MMLAIVCFTAARSAFLLSYIRIEDADAEADVEAFGLRRALQVISASSASRLCGLAPAQHLDRVDYDSSASRSCGL